MSMEITQPYPQRLRTHYIPAEVAVEGMTLTEGVKDKWRRTLFPEGATLTQENIQQLLAHQVEFICVSYTETRPPELIAVEAAMAARKILDVFSGADLSNPTMAALFNQVLVYRSA
jgi:hypothetical protein